MRVTGAYRDDVNMHAVVQHGGSTRLIGLTSSYKDGAIIRMGHLCRLGMGAP